MVHVQDQADSGVSGYSIYVICVSLMVILRISSDETTVYCPNNGNTITEITIRASDIQDLVETPQDDPQPIPSALLPASQPPSHVALPQPQSSSRFEDPAILSMGRRPQPLSTKLSTSSIPHREPVHQALGVPTPTSVAHDGTPASMNAVLNKLVATSLRLDSATVNDNDTEVHAVKTIPEISPVPKKVKSRRNRTKASHRDATQLEPTSLPKAQETNRASGWRQTPLLEPNPSFQPFTTLKKKPRGKQADGWATEDATDVQDMGEFDFEMNLSKFDKRTVFEVLKAEDMTADEDRLVGHNRLARPGTNGGKNLHPLENVLGGLKTKAVWNSEADDSEIPLEGRRGSQRESGSGRNSRRGHSQLRRPISRKETVIDDLQKLHQPPSAHTIQKGFFYTMGTDRRCDTISALQMLNLENIADSEFSLTEDMMTENAGRGIAGLTISLLSGGGRDEARGDKTPSVVVLAGNNKSGLRAVAAGRHLRNHGMNVVVCVLGLSREEDFLVGLRRQLKAFRSFGGKVLDKIQLIDFAKDHACHLIISTLR